MNSYSNGLVHFYRLIVTLMVIWTLAIIASAVWNISRVKNQTLILAKNTALSHFNKDQAFRLWATKHGGVYVPATEETPANPYLSHIPDRDIELSSGKQLTLMNPAYMLRELMEDFNELYGIKGHITSTKPLNPANAPDAWEREALIAFEKGASEVFTTVEADGQKFLRLIQPMLTTEGCLKCHARQGYKVGDIRGGVGVTVPLEPYLRIEKDEVAELFLSHLGIWLLGSSLLGLLFFRGKKFLQAQIDAEISLTSSQNLLHDFTDNSSSLIYATDLQGRFILANRALGKMVNDPPGGLIGKSREDILPAEIALEHRANDLQVIATLQALKFEEETIEADGKHIYFSVKFPLFDAGGHIYGVGGISTDNTESIKIETELETYQHHLEKLVEERTEKLEKRTVELERSRIAMVSLLQDVNKVKEELEKKVDQVERMNRVFVDRELRMAELKKEIEILKQNAENG